MALPVSGAGRPLHGTGRRKAPPSPSLRPIDAQRIPASLCQARGDAPSTSIARTRGGVWALRAAEGSHGPPAPTAGADADQPWRRNEEGPAAGEAFVPLDEEVQVAMRQRGMFPPLSGMVPREGGLHVVVTRRFDLADDWVRARRAEGITWLGYLVRLQKVWWKRRWKVVSAPREAELDGWERLNPPRDIRYAMDRGEREAWNAIYGDGSGDAGGDEDSVEEDEMFGDNDDMLGNEEDLFEDEEFEDNDAEDLFEDDEFEDDDEEDFFEDEEYEDDDEEDLFGNEELEDDGEDEYDDDVDIVGVGMHNASSAGALPQRLRKYLKKEDTEEYEDENPESLEETKAKLDQLLRGQEPGLLEHWLSDPDGPDMSLDVPEDAVPIQDNDLPIVAICAGKHVLILQLRRMRAIGRELYDLLASPDVKKIGFGHIQHHLRLRAVGITVQAGEEVGQELVRATERANITEVPYELRELQPHGLARVLVGVDISDRELYYKEFDNPLLTERQVACLSKEVFSLWAMSQLFQKTQRSDFYDIDVFILNPIPPSFVEKAQTLPATVRRTYHWQRGDVYDDLASLLPKMNFDVNVVVTRDCTVAEEWFAARRDEQVIQIGYNHEWAPGQEGKVSAIFTVATETDVIICQQLYWPTIPEVVADMLHWRRVSKFGRQLRFVVRKKGQDELCLRGCHYLFQFLLPMYNKKKKVSLPRRMQNLEFSEMVEMVLGIEDSPEEPEDNVRWDKPAFTEEEIEYQVMKAWEGWAVGTILSRATPEHGQRFMAYLMGDRYKPRKPRLPLKILRRLERLEAAESARETEVEKEGEHEPDPHMPEVLRELSKGVGDVSAEEVNDLLDALF